MKCKLDHPSEELSWQTALASDLVWIDYDGDFIAYHRPSGKTHLLNAESRHLLTDLLTEAHCLDEIVMYFIADGADSAVIADTRIKIGSILRHLETLGLVRRTP